MTKVVPVSQQENWERVFDSFRRWGYLQADLDPLGELKPMDLPELGLSGQAAEQARSFYCGTIGAEFMHIPDIEKRLWIQKRMEEETSATDRKRILDRLMRAELFEHVLQTRYPGTKRYSLEGVAALIPLLDSILDGAGQQNARQAVIAMSHRGRLTVMALVIGRSPEEIFARFEDVDPRSTLGGGDVKYHIGGTGTYKTVSGHELEMHLVSNPSHLEAVDPVALGRARAKQDRIGERARQEVLPILLHGDAAFAGQGVGAETLNFLGTEGYAIGGSIHIVVNNLIGFTTGSRELHTSRFSADLAHRLPIPILHVNSGDPDAVARAGRMALEYRYEFGSSAVVDLIGYRRHGHSEVDDPTITQPIRYKKIQSRPPLWEIYARKFGLNPEHSAEEIRLEYGAAQKRAEEIDKNPMMRTMPPYWDTYVGGRYDSSLEVDTGISPSEIQSLSKALTSYPDDFHIHPKVKKLLEQRAEMGSGQRPVDYGMAEALAFGSLLRRGIPIRLSGQDSRRGTFNQRHSALIDTETEADYVPLARLGAGAAHFVACNSPLSEASILGFEYGYSRDYPEALVLWEAQFGDFANGAQVIIDQFIVAGEDKWGLLSGLVMLLPHGYEGQGPEHSSARIERYLQLAARDNIQICQPSTAAQYFHMLRRQALRAWRKPLIVFTPKSMLRQPAASSPLIDFSRQRFLNVIPEQEIAAAKRILICSGKIGHELMDERKRRRDCETAIIFLEQIYPFPESELADAIGKHPGSREILWVQEEPANMGALTFVLPIIERIAHGIPVRTVKRSGCGSPATGSHKAHQVEQKTLLSLSFTTGHS
jgi:2-oxoglutarate dehydrogenase E1 component